MNIQTPNRSWYHWLVVAACCLLSCSSIGITINCAGIFYPAVAESLGVVQGDISLYSTIVNLVNGLMGPVVAILLRKVNFRLMLTGGMILLSCGLASLSLANSPIFFYCVAFAVGFGAALSGSIPLATVLSNWFQEKYGLASGIALSFSGVGGALLTPVFSSLIETVGWRYAYLTSGIIAASLALPGILFVLRLRPEDKGLVAYGSTEPVKKVSVAAASTQRSTFASPLFFGACLFAFLAAAVTALGAHMPGYSKELQMASSAGALMVSACMVGNISFKLILGALSDTLGVIKACTIMLTSNAIALTGLLFLPVGSTVLPLILAFFFGSIYSVCAVGAPLVVKKIFGLEKFSSVYSYVTMTACLGSAILITVAGYLFDFFATYRVAIGLFLCFSIASAATMLLINRKASKN